MCTIRIASLLVILALGSASLEILHRNICPLVAMVLA